MNNTADANRILDTIIEIRGTVRTFKTDILPKEMVEGIIHAGLWAPYAALAVTGDSGFRKFFVINRGSPILNQIGGLIRQQAQVSLKVAG